VSKSDSNDVPTTKHKTVTVSLKPLQKKAGKTFPKNTTVHICQGGISAA
jgi:hypothetical protein